jgi:four helix bundle protein
MKSIRHFRELNVYQEAMSQVMRITEMTKSFPSEERFALTDQIRRSSRSICANLAEAWRKRRYEAAFVSKLNDAETEAAETQVHLEIASGTIISTNTALNSKTTFATRSSRRSSR